MFSISFISFISIDVLKLFFFWQMDRTHRSKRQISVNFRDDTEINVLSHCQESLHPTKLVSEDLYRMITCCHLLMEMYTLPKKSFLPDNCHIRTVRIRIVCFMT